MNEHSSGPPTAEAAGATATPVSLAHEAPFQLGELLIEPALRRASRPDGAATKLEPKMMQVLVALARAGGSIVSRDELVALCWNGRIVGDDSISRVIFHLRKFAAEFAGGAFGIETTAKVGFRLVGEVASASTSPQARPRRWATKRGGMTGIITALLLAVAGLVAYDATRARPPVAVAVLPFTSAPGGQVELAAGLSDEILDRLAREPELRVAGRTSAAMFEAGIASPQEIGRRLGVDYLIEGSLVGRGKALRVNLAMIDADDGMRVWSQRFDDSQGDLFALQDRIGAAVATQLGRRLSVSSPSAGPLRTAGRIYELYLIARAMIRAREPEKFEPARDILERVVRMDPNFAPAWAELGLATMYSGIKQQNEANPPDRDANQQRALEFADRALRLAPNLASAHSARARIQGLGKEALPSIERAVALDPKDAQGWIWLSLALGEAMQFESAAEAAHECAKLEPFWLMCAQAADRLAQLGRGDAARALDQRIARFSPEPSLAAEARARLLVRAGDWSGFVAANRDAVARSNPSRRVFHSVSERSMLFRLGIPSEPYDARTDYDRINSDLLLGRIGSPATVRRALERNGVFDYQPAIAVEVHLLAQQRYADLAALGPALLASDEKDKLAKAVVGPGVAYALQRVGRKAEAERLLDQAGAVFREARSHGKISATFEYDAARYHAARGQWREAKASLLRARAQGWPDHWGQTPWIWAWPDTDPLLKPLLADPQIKRMSDQIAAQRDRERRETLVLLGRSA